MPAGRRSFLTTALLTGAAVSSRVAAAANPIITENALPGTRDWMLTKPRIDPASKYRCPWIEGYCTHTSIRAGQEITFYVSTCPASDFTLDIYRLGWYGGVGVNGVCVLVVGKKTKAGGRDAPAMASASIRASTNWSGTLHHPKGGPW